MHLQMVYEIKKLVNFRFSYNKKSYYNKEQFRIPYNAASK